MDRAAEAVKTADVLHVIAPAAVGGAESVVLALSEGLAAAGHRTAIAAVVDGPAPHPFVADAHSRGLCVTEIRSGHRRYRRQARAIAEAARAAGARLLHTHGFHADVVGYWSGRMTGLPVVSTLHGFTGEGFRAKVYDRVLRFVHPRVSAVIAVSPAIARRLESRGVTSARVHRIPNAWRPVGEALSREAARRELGIDAEVPLVGWVGRISAEKGPDIMLEAWAALDHPTARLSMVGDGPLREALEARATELGIADRVRWHGLVRNATRCFPAFDVLALSSRTEGAPMVLLEAMTMRVPIVTAAVGGIPDMLTDEQALLVEPESTGALAAALRAALDDSAAARARADAAYHRLERDFSADAWIARHAALYETVSGSGRRLGPSAE